MVLSKKVRVFEASLLGSREVPVVITPAKGKFRAYLKDSVLHYRLLVHDITGLTHAQVHLGCPEDNGPIGTSVV